MRPLHRRLNGKAAYGSKTQPIVSVETFRDDPIDETTYTG